MATVARASGYWQVDVDEKEIAMTVTEASQMIEAEELKRLGMDRDNDCEHEWPKKPDPKYGDMICWKCGMRKL